MSQQKEDKMKKEVDITSKYIGSAKQKENVTDHRVINETQAKRKIHKMQQLNQKYNNIVNQMRKEDLTSAGLVEKIKHYFNRNQRPTLVDLFERRIDTIRDHASSLRDSVEECQNHKEEIFKSMTNTKEELEQYKNKYSEIRNDILQMGAKRDKLINKGVTPDRFEDESIELYRLEDALRGAGRQATNQVHLKKETEKYHRFYDFHVQLYNEIISLGEQACGEVKLHADKMEELIPHLQNPQAVVEDFLNVYKELKNAENYMEKIYNCMMDYTKVISGIGLPSMLGEASYQKLGHTKDAIKERSKKLTKDYKNAIKEMDKEMEREEIEPNIVQ